MNPAKPSSLRVGASRQLHEALAETSATSTHAIASATCPLAFRTR